MLILVAGVTGNLGAHFIEQATAAGHNIRGLGRTPSKLSPALHSKLESFIQSDSYTDPGPLAKAVAGVDAIICCYAGTPTAVLDSQLALLRAAEAASITIFHAHTWNADWRKLSFGDWEHYDAYLAFRRHVDLTSTIKPVYVFTGLLGELALNPLFGIAHFKEDNTDDGKGPKTLAHWGTGDEKWDFTYLPDAARYSLSLITSNPSVLKGEGGFFSIRSAEASARDIAAAYAKLHPLEQPPKLESLGTPADLYAKIEEARRTIPLNRYLYYAAYFLQAASVEGRWKMEGPVVVGGKGAVEGLFGAQIKGPGA